MLLNVQQHIFNASNVSDVSNVSTVSDVSNSDNTNERDKTDKNDKTDKTNQENKKKQVIETKKEKITLEYTEAELETNETGDRILKLPEIPDSQLPDVSIVTLTYNRSEMLPIAIRNFQRFDYPIGKMQWVIVDDSNERHQAINKKLVERDPRVKYVPLKKAHTNLRKTQYWRQ